MAVREQAVLAHHLDRPVERHRVHVRAEQDGRRALGPGTAPAGCPSPSRLGALSSSSTSRPEPRSSSVSASAIARSRPDGLSISQKRMKSASSRSRSSVDAAWITPRTLPLDRPALALPARDAAVHHVDHVVGAEALQQARGDRRALARAADRGDGRSGVELRPAARGCRGRAVWIEPGMCPRPTPPARARRAPGSRRGPPQRSWSSLDGQPLDALDRLLLLAPRRHAAGEVAGDVLRPDRAGELRRPRGRPRRRGPRARAAAPARRATRASSRSRRAAR